MPYINQRATVKCIVDGYLVQYGPVIQNPVPGGPIYGKLQEEFASGLTQVKSILDEFFGPGTPVPEPDNPVPPITPPP